MLRIRQLAVLAGMLLTFAAGCARRGAEPETGEAGTAVPATTTTAIDDHGGWWCSPHGVPEEECGQCNSQLAAEFQKKGDWCAEHDRPDSQCFVCHPELQAQFAARYEAKFGEPPPEPEG